MHNDRQYSLCTIVDSCLNEHHKHCSIMLVFYFIHFFFFFGGGGGGGGGGCLF